MDALVFTPAAMATNNSNSTPPGMADSCDAIILDDALFSPFKETSEEEEEGEIVVVVTLVSWMALVRWILLLLLLLTLSLL